MDKFASLLLTFPRLSVEPTRAVKGYSPGWVSSPPFTRLGGDSLKPHSCFSENKQTLVRRLDSHISLKRVDVN